jgi:hypothetical protein
MPANSYDFITHWRVQGSCKEVFEILVDAPSLKRWWPSVYLDVKELERGDPETGVGRQIELFTKGWLPYTLRWSFTVTESQPPDGFSLIPRGDFTGRGDWHLFQDGEWVDVFYEWRIDAEKALLRYLSPVVKPIFAANHYWAMNRGEESLKLELERRRATSEAERARIPPPPAPTFFRVSPAKSAGKSGEDPA